MALRQLDMGGRACETCGEGKYVETCLEDDWHGNLHCNVCDVQVKRWRDIPIVEKSMVYFFLASPTRYLSSWDNWTEDREYPKLFLTKEDAKDYLKGQKSKYLGVLKSCTDSTRKWATDIYENHVLKAKPIEVEFNYSKADWSEA